MTSVPLLVETSESKQVRCIYLKTKIFFLNFFFVFRISIKFGTFSKKDDAHSLCISEITDHKRRASIKF